MTNIINNPPSRVGLVGEWLLDGNALDTSGNGYNGTATNVFWTKTTKGYQSQAGSFNGSSSYITIPYNANLAGSNNMTISMFVYILSVGTYKTLMVKQHVSSANTYFLDFNTSGNFVFGVRDSTASYPANGLMKTNNTFSAGRWYHLVGRLTNKKVEIFIDGKLQATTNYSNASYGDTVTNTVNWTSNTSNITIGYQNFSGYYFYFGGNIQNVRYFNKSLSQDEIQLLYLEGQRKLGPSNIRAYPKLFDGLVGYFENPIGTELWNIATGVKSTYVGGTNTTDNLGNNKAITNPNYTWTSITYTTGYTFENSGSGWSIVTSPTGLSTTGINRTTNLRNIFLFSRTLSTDEVNTLQTLCNLDYIYPAPSYDLPNLREGLVLDLNEQGKDLSGNGNNGTLVNSPTVVRQGKAKGLTYNGSNQYIDCGNILNITGDISIFTWIKQSGGTNYERILSKYYTNISNYAGYQIQISNNGVLQGEINNINSGSTSYYKNGTKNLKDGKWHLVGLTRISGQQMKLWVDGVEDIISVTNGTPPTSISTTTNTLNIGRLNFNGTWYYGNITVENPRIRNRALSSKEIQQLYYSQKANFVY